MAREGLVFFFPALIVTVILLGFWIISPQMWLLISGILSGILTLFFGYFFRDPNRIIPSGEGILISPADGFISTIKPLNTHPFLNSSAIQVSIFLTIFDVHINRVPISGVVDNVNYKPGKFLAAYNDHASDENEQTEIWLTTIAGVRIAFKQIAGQLARRIVCRLKEGQNVTGGDRFGLIKFGSRTDIIVPADTKIEVQKGQHVKGGSTIIGRLSVNQTPKAESSESKHDNA